MEFDEHKLDELLRENERTLRDLADAAADLAEFTGRGESRSGLTSAEIGPDGRLRDVRFAARAMRLEAADLSEEVVQAVRQAQDDLERQARERLAVPMDQEIGLEAVRSQFEELKESFVMETGERNARLRRLREPRDG
jgi:DNA-binding protein YbaB